MDIYVKKRNEVLAETVIKGLKSRNMTLLCRGQGRGFKAGFRADSQGQQHFHGRLYAPKVV